MANTYTLIQGITLSSAVSSVTFSAIPNTYTDIMFRISARDASSGNWSDLRFAFNGVTTDFYWRGLYGLGTTTGSNSNTGIGGTTAGNSAGNTNTANLFSNGDVYIGNYASTSTPKCMSIDSSVENNGTGNILQLATTLWYPSTSVAISSVTFTNSNSANFLIDSTFYLYGIKNS